MEWVAENNGASASNLGKRKVRPKRFEFKGWGSRDLIEFLEFRGEDTSKKLSQYDVAEIVNKYAAEKKLILSSKKSKKKKKITCDDRLLMLFGKKSISRNKVYELLEVHYAENGNDSDFDFLYSSDDEQQRSFPPEKRAYRKREDVPKSSFPAIVSDNIKLLYLRRSLVQELVKAPETFESKMLGSFVRIKSDPYDYLQKNPYQLVQVTGVKKEHGTDDFLLQVTNHVKDVSISMLSDDNFSEEECEDLHQRVKNGYLKRLTVGEMEEKVCGLHEDLTKHWLQRELALLQRLIDQASEKGWHKEKFEYLEKRDLLKSEEEQSRLLREVPEVIAEELEPARKEHSDDDREIENGRVVPHPGAAPEAHQGDKDQQLSGSPMSINQATPKICKILDEKKQPENGFLSPSLHEILDIPKLVKEQQNDCFLISSPKAAPKIRTFQMAPNGRLPTMNASAVAGVIDLDNGFQTQRKPPEVIDLIDDDDDDDEEEEVETQNPRSGNDAQAFQDHYDIGKQIWLYKDPQGDTQGPFSLLQLKVWSELDYFPPEFKVWMVEQSPDSAMLLTGILRRLGRSQIL